MKRAVNLEGVYSVLRQKPLTIEQMDNFYCLTNKARGTANPRDLIKLHLKQNESYDSHLLFVGYRGCGKSTELNYLEKEIQDDYLVFNFSIFEELDPSNINYMEIYIVTMERLFSFIEKHALTINHEYLTNISNFLKIKEIEQMTEKYLGGELELGSNTEITIPFLQKFFANFKASAKASKSFKQVLKDTVEPHFPQLIRHCNELINEVRLKLSFLKKKDILIIIEDTDKINIDVARDLFFNHADQMIGFKTNVIYTLPISLYFDLQFNAIKGYFTNTYELAMIKINEKDGTPVEEGYTTMREIIDARMDLALFQDIEILNIAIKYSGGCLRDLLNLIIEMSNFAQIDSRTKISQADWKEAYLKLKKEYRYTIADYSVNGQVKYTASQFYTCLVELAKSESKDPDNTDITMLLRQNLCILGYNGTGWCDVHPIVRDILKDRSLI